MFGLLSVATTAVSSAKVDVDSGEVGSSAVYKYSRYNNGPRTLPSGMPALAEETSVFMLCK
jgi:hypothetical protein